MRVSSTAAYWPEAPIIRRIRPGSATTSTPSIRAEPASGTTSVVSTLTTVVLPAPYRPEQALDGPLGHGQVQPGQDVDGARAGPVRPGEALDLDEGRIIPPLRCRSCRLLFRLLFCGPGPQPGRRICWDRLR